MPPIRGILFTQTAPSLGGLFGLILPCLEVEAGAQNSDIPQNKNRCKLFTYSGLP